MRIAERRLRRVIRQVILESSSNQIGSEEKEKMDNVISDYFSGNMTQTESDSGKISPEGEKLGEEMLKQSQEKPNFARAIKEEFGNVSRNSDLFMLTSVIAGDLTAGGFMFNEESAFVAAAGAFLLKFYKAWERTR
jgi:hypothetical protein